MTQEEKRAKWREYYHRKHPVKPASVVYHPTHRRLVVRDHYATRIFWNQQMLDYLKRNYATMLNSDLAEWLGVSVRTTVRKARELGLQKDAQWLASVWKGCRMLACASNKINGNPGCFKKGMHASPATEFKTGRTYNYNNRAL